MHKSLALLALATSALATPMPQGVTESIAPESSTPEGCQTSHDGTFEMTVVNVTESSAKRDLHSRQDSGTLTLQLSDSVLTDQAGRTGYIAANYQFQFDSPPQTGAIYTSGFSMCSNNSLALGGSAIFYQCISGSFFNLYDRMWAEHCVPVYFVALTGSSSSGSSPASQVADGQPQATTGSAPVSQITDGQPQAATGAAVTQIADGQPQAATGAPVTQIADGQPQAPTGAAVTQIADGQPQAPTGAAVTQIADGQPQAATGAAVTQIADGQPQAATGTGAAVTQIADGQPQAATGSGAAVTQIADGQPQAATGTGAAVTQIADGQPQAATGSGAAATQTGAAVTQIADGQPQAATGSSAAPATFTGAAHHDGVHGGLAIVAGIAGAVLLI